MVAVLIFYIDESGHHSGPATDETQPQRSEWFVLSAVGIRDTSRRPLAEALDALKRTHLGDAGEWGDTELKGRRLAVTRKRIAGLGRERDIEYEYASVRSAQQHAALVHATGLMFDRFRPLTFTVAIDRTRLEALHPGSSALGWAYAFLYRRIAVALERLYPGEGGVLVCDRQDAHEKQFTSGELLRIRDELATRAHLKADYRILLDRPLWMDPTQSTWDREIIQLADLVAFTTHEGVKRGFDSDDARGLWPSIRASLNVDAKTGRPDEEGLVIFPKPAAWPETH